MKAFQKLALVSAIAMTSSAFAMEAADDATLSEATGQDGITILVAPGYLKGGASGAVAALGGINVTGLTTLGVSVATQDQIDLVVNGGNGDTLFKGLSIRQVIQHDSDGFAGSVAAGALVIGGGAADDSTVLIADNVNPIKIDIDTSGDANGDLTATDAVLNVKITLPKLALKTGAIYVAHSNGAGTAVDNMTTKVMGGIELVIDSATMNVQLGNEGQRLYGSTFAGTADSGGGTTALNAADPTVMVRLGAVMNNGLVINKTEIKDAGGAYTGGSIYNGSLKIENNGNAVGVDRLDVLAGVNVENDLLTMPGSNMTAGFDADAARGGLIITLGQLGSATGGANLTMSDVRLGNIAYLGSGAVDTAVSAKALGDMEIIGLNLNGASLIIHGH